MDRSQVYHTPNLTLQTLFENTVITSDMYKYMVQLKHVGSWWNIERVLYTSIG